MAQAAKVLSVQSLKDFRVSMITFVEEARNALGGVDMELKRMRDWLERDQLSYWQMQVKRRHEAMMNARTELHRRRIAQQGSDAISDTEQKEALREAQKRLRVAEEKVEMVKKLIPIFHHAAAEYTSRATPLADHLSGGMEKSIFSLSKMVESLESYLALKAPSAPPVETAGGSGSGMASAKTGGTKVSPSGSTAAEGESEAGEEPQESDGAPTPAAEPVSATQGNPIHQEHES